MKRTSSSIFLFLFNTRNGTTLILYDEDTMHTFLVTVRLELDNCTLTWYEDYDGIHSL